MEILKGDILFVGLCILAVLFKSPTIVAWWVNLSILDQIITCRNPQYYQSMSRWYPQRECIGLKKYKFLFKEIETNTNTKIKYIPKEMYYNTLIQSTGFAGYTILALIALFVHLLFGKTAGEAAGIIFSVIYFVVMFVIDNYFDIKIYRKKKKLEKGKIVKSPETLPDSTTDNSKKRKHTATNVKKTKKKREKNRQKKK